MTLCTVVADLTDGRITVQGRGAAPTTIPLSDFVLGAAGAPTRA
jgi:hypothetical protein